MKKRIKRYLLFFVGILSLIWFLIRVIPKPYRATYPCQRAAFPLASAFLVYLIGLIGSSVFFKKAISIKNISKQERISFLLLSLIVSFIFTTTLSTRVSSAGIKSAQVTSNSPVGSPKGIFPGRVVWVFDSDATRAELTNTTGDYWFNDINTNQKVVQDMVNTTFCTLAGTDNLYNAIDTIFRHFNLKKNISSGYVKGEKIMIKCNFQISSSVNKDYENSNDFLKSCTLTSPQMVYSILNLLINIYNVDQKDIYVGDPVKYFTKPYFDKCHSAFPDVHYVNAKTENSREALTYSSEPLFFSGDSLISNILPQIYQEASYVINLAVLKTHSSAGITSCAKNHFGSLALPATLSASHLHYSLPSNKEGNNQYRMLVDIMGHKLLGENTVMFLVEGLWGGGGPQGKASPPVKWTIPPFNNDYPSSVFASLDPVAVESVCFDFCLAQYSSFFSQDLITGVEDYLIQAANPEIRPDKIVYDPERDGSPINYSLGVYEHWNNVTDKYYSGNLNQGIGIELVRGDNLIHANGQISYLSTNTQGAFEIYPNPVNKILYIQLPASDSYTLLIFEVSGKQIMEKNLMDIHSPDKSIDVSNLKKGTYILLVKSLSGTIYKKKFVKK